MKVRICAAVCALIVVVKNTRAATVKQPSASVIAAASNTFGELHEDMFAGSVSFVIASQFGEWDAPVIESADSILDFDALGDMTADFFPSTSLLSLSIPMHGVEKLGTLMDVVP